MPALPVDGDPAACHAAADPSDFLQIAVHLDLVARLAIDGKEVVDAALALAEIHRQRADAALSSVTMTSGQMLSASSGTPSTGCLSVSVIIRGHAGPRHARHDLRVLEPRHLRRIVFERHRIQLLEDRADEVLDRRVEFGLHHELAPFGDRSDLPLLNDDLPAFQHVSRVGEHHTIAVGLRRIDRHVAIRTDAKVPLLFQAERARRSRRRDDGDLGDRCTGGRSPASVIRFSASAGAFAPLPCGTPRPSAAA